MVHDYPPLTGGGLALAVRDLSEVLADDFDVAISTSRLVDHFADDRHRDGAARARPWLRSIATADCLVVHWTYSFRWLSTLALLLGPALRRPTVCVLHTAPAHCDYNRMRRVPDGVLRAALSWVARLMSRCEGVVALSPSHAREVRRAGFAVTHVLPLPVDPGRHLAMRSLRELPASPLRIGVLGELSVMKGSDDLAGLFDVLLPEHTVVIAGRGPYQEALCAVLHRLSTEVVERLVLTEPLPPEDMPSLYENLDCLLLCSRTESQCRVAIEAMLAGVIVLARHVTGVEDLIIDRQTGFIIDPAEPAAVRDTLDDILQRPELVSAVRRSARARAEAVVRLGEHGWPLLVKQVSKV